MGCLRHQQDRLCPAVTWALLNVLSRVAAIPVMAPHITGATCMVPTPPTVQRSACVTSGPGNPRPPRIRDRSIQCSGQHTSTHVPAQCQVRRTSSASFVTFPGGYTEQDHLLLSRESLKAERL